MQVILFLTCFWLKFINFDLIIKRIDVEVNYLFGVTHVLLGYALVVFDLFQLTEGFIKHLVLVSGLKGEVLSRLL